MSPGRLPLMGVALLVACGDVVSTERGSEATESARPAAWQSLDDEAAETVHRGVALGETAP